MWLIGAALLIGGFVKLTTELLEGELLPVDRSLLNALARFRSPVLTSVALDVTALGSPTLIGLFSLVAICVCVVRADRAAALQILVAASSAPFLAYLVKAHVERARPTEVERLVAVSGFSYPSGHALSAAYFYLTLAIVIWTRSRSRRASTAALILAIVLGLLVALSRAYLGVHYPSDGLGGVAMGAGLAVLLAGAFSLSRARRRRAPSTAS